MHEIVTFKKICIYTCALEVHSFTGFILPYGQQTVKLLFRVQTCLQLEYFAFQLCFRITMTVHGSRVQNQTLQCRRTGY
jgi:hypothetical protein